MFIVCLLLQLCLAGCQVEAPTDVQSVFATDSVRDDPDGPAIYIHSADPSRSPILGTNNSPAPTGALAVFGLDGKARQTIDNLELPNNVGVEYGLLLNGPPADIAVLIERPKRRRGSWKTRARRRSFGTFGGVCTNNKCGDSCAAPPCRERVRL